MCNEAISLDTCVIVVVALHCDLSYRTNYGTDGRKGLLRLRDPAPLSDLTNLITTWDYTWRHEQGISVVWTLPYVPNFLRYNQQRARFRGINQLCELHTEEALWSARTMREVLRNFSRILRARKLTVIEFEGRVTAYELSHNSDGVHLSRRSQKKLLDGILEQAVDTLVVNPPPTIARVLTPEMRLAKALKRRRYRNRKSNDRTRRTTRTRYGVLEGGER